MRIKLPADLPGDFVARLVSIWEGGLLLLGESTALYSTLTSKGLCSLLNQCLMAFNYAVRLTYQRNTSGSGARTRDQSICSSRFAGRPVAPVPSAGAFVRTASHFTSSQHLHVVNLLIHLMHFQCASASMIVHAKGSLISSNKMSETSM